MKTLPQEIEIGLVRVTNNVMLDFCTLQGEQCDSIGPWIGKSGLHNGIDERKFKLVKIIESGLVRMFLAEIYNYMPECERKDSSSQIVHSAEYPTLKRKLEETDLELNTLKYLESHKNAKVRLHKKRETIRRASLELASLEPPSQEFIKLVTLFEEYRIFSEMIDFCPNYLLGDTGKTIIGHCAELILAVYQNEIDPLKLQVQSVRNLPRIHKVIEHVLDTLIDINNEEADEIILHLVDCLIQAINQAEEMKLTWLCTQVLFENLPDPGFFVIDICKSLVIKYSNPIIDDILLLILKGIHIYGSAKVPLGSHQLGTATKLVEMLEIVFRSQCIKMPVSLEDHCTSPHLHRLVQICLKGLLQYSK